LSVIYPDRQNSSTPGRIDAAELYRLCRNKDEDAWRVLFAWCLKKAKAKLPQQAEEIAQRVCLKMLDGGLDKIEDARKFLGYVRTTLNNQVIDYYRKEVRQVSLQGQPDDEDEVSGSLADRIPAPQAPPDQRAEARLLLGKLAELISLLPEYCEGVMGLYIRYRLGLIQDYREMAGHLDVSINTLSVQIKRCLDKLRQLPEFEDFGRQGGL
jgi:RNA polymerase sigma factor (sigma-70 family)